MADKQDKKNGVSIGRYTVNGAGLGALTATSILGLNQLADTATPALTNLPPIDHTKLVSPLPSSESNAVAEKISELALGEEKIGAADQPTMEFPSDAAKMIHSVSDDKLGFAGDAALRVAFGGAGGAGLGALSGLAAKRRREKAAAAANETTTGGFVAALDDGRITNAIDSDRGADDAGIGDHVGRAIRTMAGAGRDLDHAI